MKPDEYLGEELIRKLKSKPHKTVCWDEERVGDSRLGGRVNTTEAFKKEEKDAYTEDSIYFKIKRKKSEIYSNGSEDFRGTSLLTASVQVARKHTSPLANYCFSSSDTVEVMIDSALIKSSSALSLTDSPSKQILTHNNRDRAKSVDYGKLFASSTATRDYYSEKGRRSIQAGYELCLLKSYQMSDNLYRFPLLAELSITSSIASDVSTTKKFVFCFEAGYFYDQDFTFTASSLCTGLLSPTLSDHAYSKYSEKFPWKKIPNGSERLAFHRNSLVQLIVRNPQDGCIADIFVVKLELTDMPVDTQTIHRQKIYRMTDASGNNSEIYKMLEMPLMRCFDPISRRQKIKLAGPIKLAISFNRSTVRSSYRQPQASQVDVEGVEAPFKTKTVVEYPVNPKYYALHPSLIDNGPVTEPDSSSIPPILERVNSPQSFQHGSLCV